jgi:hypothetical protein
MAGTKDGARAGAPWSRESAELAYEKYRAKLEEELTDRFNGWRNDLWAYGDDDVGRRAEISFQSFHSFPGLRGAVGEFYLAELPSFALLLVYRGWTAAEMVAELRKHVLELMAPLEARIYRTLQQFGVSEEYRSDWFPYPDRFEHDISAGFNDFFWALSRDTVRADEL